MRQAKQPKSLVASAVGTASATSSRPQSAAAPTSDAKTPSSAPLAERLRPRALPDFWGQDSLTREGSFLRRAINDGRLFSMILWGPPGCGKTTLARILANQTQAIFVEFSGVNGKKADISQVILEARARLKTSGARTLVFVDELHRFNKAQQDTFLPCVEDGSIILIGATTENPSLSIISPLMSRCRVLVLKPLSPEALKDILHMALTDKERGLGDLNLNIPPEALDYLINASTGDARIALNVLEAAALSHHGKDKDLTVAEIKDALQYRGVNYDRRGSNHYDIISAFIKSLRGSDPDAVLYWLARMLAAGEDPRFIARRMVILASEDIGNACPTALVVAVAAFQALELVGLPEAQLNLAQAATYLARAPKSNASYMGLLAAQADVKDTLNLPVPLHLRNAVTKLMSDLGYGKDYKYPHDQPVAAATQSYLPDELRGHTYYHDKKSAGENQSAKN